MDRYKSDDFITNYIWNLKYRYKSFNGDLHDYTMEDTWNRIAASASTIEIEKKYWYQKFYNALYDFKFIPAGRIIAGLGTNRNITLINTFLMGKIEDDLQGIFKALNESAYTMSQGGGIGCDFSSIRPRGTEIKGVERASSGPIPFMDMWDQMCQTILDGGINRGAMMATLRCDHPDIEEFIDSKKNNSRLTKFNISVLITNEFVTAAQTYSPWDLKFNGQIIKTISASYLWNKIMETTYRYSEPGVLFIDLINAKNKLSYCEEIIGTNSCGEQPLPYYGSAPLASINLAKLVKDPFTEKAELNIEELEELVHIGIRFLDNIVTISKYPVIQQKNEAENKRRIGLGITGLADALAMCNIRYGSYESIKTVESWLSALRDSSYLASAKLGKEKGSFSFFDKKKFINKLSQLSLPDDIIFKVESLGMRNGNLNSIAPTGTISLLAGNISSGIEPIFNLSTKRRILTSPNEYNEIQIDDYAYKQYKKANRTQQSTPDFFVSSKDILPEEHLLMQAVAQNYIDGAISKTINCPENISYSDFENIYVNANAHQCKGCTTYRANDSRGYVIM